MARLINKADQGELNKPHYRVSFNKDGSVISADRVEGPKNDRGGYIQYVQADTKEEAIALARKRVAEYEALLKRKSAYLAARIAAARADDKCARCHKREAKPGTLCGVCREYGTKYSRKYRSPDHEPKRHARTEAEKLAARERLAEQYRENSRRWTQLSKQVFGTTSGLTQARTKLAYAKSVLAMYDRVARLTGYAMPELRAWLVTEVESLERDIAACSIRAQQAAAAE